MPPGLLPMSLMERVVRTKKIKHFLPIYFPGCVLYVYAFVSTQVQTQNAHKGWSGKELLIINEGFGSIFSANLSPCIISFDTQKKNGGQ